MFSLKIIISLFLLFISLSLSGQSIPERDSVINVLFTVDENDQKFRNQLEDVQAKYGGDSKEMKELNIQMKKADSLNLIIVESVLSKYGWLSVNDVGSQGNTTLFMVIQHSDIKTQEKYLPLMREAVKNNKANAHSLALLEDRVALLQGKKQIYGSQVSWNMKTNIYFVAPLEDPDSVDKRRAEVGLGLLADYIKECCDLIWNVEQYKTDLPRIEEEFFKKK